MFDLLKEERLQHLLDAENIILECISELNCAMNLVPAFDKILELLGDFLEAERTYFFEINGNTMRNTNEWCANGIKPQINELQNIPIIALGKQNTSFKDSRCIVLDNFEGFRVKHPDEYEDLHSQGIERLVIIPILQADTLLGYIGIDNPPLAKIEDVSVLLSILGYFISGSIRQKNDKLLLETLNYCDSLTGALNRNAFIRDLESFITLSEPVGVVCVDINGMKEINDKHGHPFGDQILVSAAKTLSDLFGFNCLYRSGGDEFTVICRSVSATELEESVQELRVTLNTNSAYRASIGYQWAEECSAIQRILFEADQMMYVNKKQFYHGQASSRYRHNNDDVLGLTKPGALQKLICEGAFLVYFQPKVSVYSGRQIGAEALVRLRAPTGAIVPPDQFIPILEQAHLISQIDFYVFEQVCANILQWRTESRNVVPISVNFSRYSLTEIQFQSRLRDIWLQYDIPQDLLEIEITESVEADDSYNFLQVIEQTRATGFSVSIDDFGVRHANLSLFTAVDFDVLKIDKSLVSDLTRNPKARAIIQSVTDICRKMGIRLIAEGVETEEQVSILQELDCNGAQGYLFSRPLPQAEYESKYLSDIPIA